ncbi:hypothetical protein ACFWNK_01715 [Streptomyces sp. NPDC058417]|uniref:hypothetical protein n=1 Tax=unclassified Streptomyces TaxID=2593676 RepID=UPI0036498328
MPHATARPRVDAIPPDVLTLLGLPDRADLPDAQQRGAVCAWCPETLAGESAIDLGEQTDRAGHRWYPRACVICAGERAHDALFGHAKACRDCASDSEGLCPVMRTLYRLVQQEWR